MKRSNFTGVAIACAFAIVAVACRTVQPTSAADGLRGVEWRLVEVSGRPAVPEAVGARPTLRFDADSMVISANFGCNGGGGEFTLGPNNEVRFGTIITTLRACEDDRMNQQESAMKNALATTDRYRIVGDTLELRLGDSVLARFVR